MGIDIRVLLAKLSHDCLVFRSLYGFINRIHPWFYLGQSFFHLLDHFKVFHINRLFRFHPKNRGRFCHCGMSGKGFVHRGTPQFQVLFELVTGNELGCPHRIKTACPSISREGFNIQANPGEGFYSVLVLPTIETTHRNLPS